MNTPVSFPLARLLKDKNIHILSAKSMYASNGELTDAVYDFDDWCFAPTIAEVVMWLYEKHEYWCYTYTNGKIWHPCIQHKFGDMAVLSGKIGEFNSPTKAYEKGIEYILNNMI